MCSAYVGEIGLILVTPMIAALSEHHEGKIYWAISKMMKAQRDARSDSLQTVHVNPRE